MSTGSGQVYIYDTDWIPGHFSSLRTRTEMVLKMLVSSAFNHLTWLAARESFIAFSGFESFRSYSSTFLFLTFLTKPSADSGSRLEVTVCYVPTGGSEQVSFMLVLDGTKVVGISGALGTAI
jgi:hypothetical protein